MEQKDVDMTLRNLDSAMTDILMKAYSSNPDFPEDNAVYNALEDAYNVIKELTSNEAI
mgnify:CR=1 FL=1